MNDQPTPRSPWRTPLLAGCGCLGAVAVAVITVVSLNWTTLSKVAMGAAETMAELQAVQTAVLSRYGPAQVSVKAKRFSGVRGTILSIQVVNAPALSGLSGEAARIKALEIATVGRDALRRHDSYQHFEVILGRQVQVGVSFNANEAFRFAASELPAPKAATPTVP